MRIIAEEGCGVILYLHNTSRGFSIDHTPATAPNAALNPALNLENAAVPDAAFNPDGAAIPANPQQTAASSTIRNYAPAKALRPAPAASLRAIGLGGQILSDLGIQRIRLLSNTPMHIPALEGFGLEIVEQVPIPVEECSRVV